ncbi:hypothetical protein [Taibaiella sp. KBW10]|uniref:hypothetical protein n=1 Tax=Taibaiella sp. KBW10 TaxID=2153357 RepID=UPI000F591C9F|nr:hypothetical protein [Taibaiella sp. KBW10]
MKITSLKIMLALVAFTISTLCYGQSNFKHEKIKLVHDIFHKTTKQNINAFMKERGFKIGEINEGNEEYGDELSFTSEFNLITVEYTKGNKVLSVSCIYAGAPNNVFVEMELKESGYTPTSSKYEDMDGTTRERKIWAKPGTAYLFASAKDEKEKIGVLAYGIMEE